MRKARLLMSKYGFSILVMLLELILILGLFIALSSLLGRQAPYVGGALLLLAHLVTILAVVNRSMTPESKVTWFLFIYIPLIGPLLYIMFGERRLSKKEIDQLEKIGRAHV